MTEIPTRALDALRSVRPNAASDVDGELKDIGRRIARRRTQRNVIVGLAVALVSLGAVLATQLPTAKSNTTILADGTRCIALSNETQFDIEPGTETGQTVTLQAGSARFEVEPQAPRKRFRVKTAGVVVTVIGTVFRVEREMTSRGARVTVNVDEGTVRVNGASSSLTLDAGASASFIDGIRDGAEASKDEAPVADEAPSTDTVESAKTGEVEATRISSKRRSRWRELARRKEYIEAYPLIASDPPSDQIPRDLFLAADSARLAGHPREALRYLTKIVRRHPGSEEAPLAAFTRGKLLLESVENPPAAARSFARARALGLREPLLQDCFRREVDSWTRAQELSSARSTALQYLERFPQGRFAERMRTVVRPNE